MKIKFLSALLTLSLFFALHLSAQGEMRLDSILQSYYQNAGIENIKNVQTIVQYTHFDFSGQNFNRVTYLKRPNKFRNEMEVRGTKILTIFDGKKGWMINPFAGSDEPQPMDSITIENLKEQTTFEGLLYDYKDKGYTATYEGIEDVDGTDAYVIHLSKKDRNIWYYLDAETFIPIKQKAEAVINGKNVSQEVYYSNYQQINGIAFPFLIITKGSGGPMAQMQMVIDSIKLDVPLADSLFAIQPKEQTENPQK